MAPLRLHTGDTSSVDEEGSTGPLGHDTFIRWLVGVGGKTEGGTF